MTHAGDWDRIVIINAEEERYREPACVKCNNSGRLEVDITPPDWWNSGPVAKEVPCDDCPDCDVCFDPVNIDIHPQPFRLRWISQEDSGMVFCSDICFGRFMRKIFDEEGKFHSSAGYIYSRRMIIDVILDFRD